VSSAAAPHQKIGIGQRLATGAPHPAAKGAGEVRLVAMFQHQHEAAAVFVVAQHRARAIPVRALTRAIAADCALAHRMRKRQTTLSTPRRGEEGDRRPARPTQRFRLTDRDAAGEAARRQQAIDDGAAEAAQLRRQGCGKLHRHPSSKHWAPRQAASRMDSPEHSAATLFDRRAWRAHRDRAAQLPGGGTDFLHREVAERLIDRLDLINRDFTAILDLGARDGALGRLLAVRNTNALVLSAEPSLKLLGQTRAPRICADPELIPFHDASFDLIASSVALHWCADLPGALIQLRRALKPDGLLLAALFAGSTLVELRTVLFEAELAEEGGVSPRVSPTVEPSDAASLLQRAGLAMPVSDSETITATYPDMLALMRDLRSMGETNALAARRRFLSRATLARAAAIYAERFPAPEGRITATFEVLFLTGWAPHPDQMKPRPGPRRRIA
jgi:SAM-dependent methyltransferase